MADPNHVPRGALQEEKEMADSLRPAKIECPFCCRSFSKLKPHLQTCRVPFDKPADLTKSIIACPLCPKTLITVFDSMESLSKHCRVSHKRNFGHGWGPRTLEELQYAACILCGHYNRNQSEHLNNCEVQYVTQMKAEAKKQAKIEARLARRPRPPTPPRKKVTHQLMPERENSDSDFENPPTEEDWENIRIRHLTYTRQNEENRLKKLAKEEKKIEVKAKKAWAAKKREEKRERARIRQEKKITAQEEKEAREQLKVERKELLKQANESRKMAREIRKMAKEKKMARKKSKMAKETKIATANRKMVDEKKKMSIVSTKPVVGKKSNKKKLNRKERKNPISKVKYLEKSQTRITKFFKPPRSTVTKPEECPSKPSCSPGEDDDQELMFDTSEMETEIHQNFSDSSSENDEIFTQPDNKYMIALSD